MIKFFRKTRYNLMSENKTYKYFKYAVGEIILVMIGILLALQVNNWNEGRKLKIKSKVIVEKIINDLTSDTLNINKLIKMSNLSEEKIKKYFSYYESLSFSNDNVDKLLDSINKVHANYMNYYPINNTFKNMESEAAETLLTSVQRDYLISLVARQDEIKIIIDSNLKRAHEEIELSDSYRGYPVGFYQKLNLKNSIERKAQALLHAHLYNNALSELYYYIELKGEDIKKRSKKAIELLNK